MYAVRRLKPERSSATPLGDKESNLLLLPDLKPPLSPRLGHVQLITGFVFPRFIQPLRPCGPRVIVCKSFS